VRFAGLPAGRAAALHVATVGALGTLTFNVMGAAMLRQMRHDPAGIQDRTAPRVRRLLVSCVPRLVVADGAVPAGAEPAARTRAKRMTDAGSRQERSPADQRL
jgi:uncharacterized protein involved in response to NO